MRLINWIINLFKKPTTIVEKPVEVVEKPAPIGTVVFGSDEWYLKQWSNMVVDKDHERELIKAAQKIVANKNRYVAIEYSTHIPWQMIAAIHWRESSLNFNTCLHNGDPLPGPTRNVPRGRGPFETWEAAAIDALRFDGLDLYKTVESWTLVDMLKKLESYNGFGYRKRGLPSCYLWSCTNVCHEKGRYTYDGFFDVNAKTDDYLGAAPILKYLTNNK